MVFVMRNGITKVFSQINFFGKCHNVLGRKIHGKNEERIRFWLLYFLFMTQGRISIIDLLAVYIYFHWHKWNYIQAPGDLIV